VDVRLVQGVDELPRAVMGDVMGDYVGAKTTSASGDPGRSVGSSWPGHAEATHSSPLLRWPWLNPLGNLHRVGYHRTPQLSALRRGPNPLGLIAGKRTGTSMAGRHRPGGARQSAHRGGGVVYGTRCQVEQVILASRLPCATPPTCVIDGVAGDVIDGVE
jgi:hypothetical protein